MDQNSLRELLVRLSRGDCQVDDALEALANRRASIGFAHIDHERATRCGFPEVVFCEGKQDEHAVAIVTRLVEAHGKALATRAGASLLAKLHASFPRGTVHADARVFHVDHDPAPPSGSVAVLSAGTSDIPVAEEAAVTASAMGAEVVRVYDVGVAGVHRLLERKDDWQKAHALVVVAGMEGALPSLVGGLVDRPVIAVPTSIGYGAAFGGVAALLGMLTGCAAGVTVVNIDNGFGAGYAAATINRLIVSGKTETT